MPDRLTKSELRSQVAEIAEIVRVDYWNILERERESRTPVLEVMKRELVRGPHRTMENETFSAIQLLCH